MPFPFAALGALAALSGGGGGEQNTSVTTQNDISNIFNPTSTVNVGGGVATYPYASSQQSPSLSTSQASGGRQPSYAGFGGTGQGYDPYASGGGGSLIDTLLGNPLYLVGGVGIVYFLMRGR